MKYRTQAGVEVELSEEDLRKLRKTEEGKHTPEALFEKACRNIAHIANKKEDDIHDEKSIKEALGEIVRFGSSAEVGDAIFEAAAAACRNGKISGRRNLSWNSLETTSMRRRASAPQV